MQSRGRRVRRWLHPYLLHPTSSSISPLRCCRGGDDEKKGLKANSPAVFTALKTFWRTILYIKGTCMLLEEMGTLSFGRLVVGTEEHAVSMVIS